MSALKDQLQSDLTDAIRAQDELTMATLRMALSAITNAEVSGKQARELTDDELIELLESAGYRVELIRTPTSVMVRLNEGPLIIRPF